MFRKIIAGLAASLVVASLVVFGSSSAFAAESDLAIAPVALGECDVHKPGGGWDDRSLVSEGTSSGPESLPVRPKHLRLGEPCVQTGSLMYLPMRFTDIPQPMVDEDEDGVDDPPPGAGECDLPGVGPASLNGGVNLGVISGAAGLCGSVRLAWNTGSAVELGDPIGIGVEATAANSVRLSIGDNPHASVGNSGIGVWCMNASGFLNPAAGALAQSLASSSPVPAFVRDFTCTVSGTTVYAVTVSRSAVSGIPAQWGLLWRTDQQPVEPGGFYGGTQGAQFHITGNTHSPLAGDEPGPLSAMYCRSDPSDKGTRFAVDLEISVEGFLGDLVPATGEDDEIIWDGWAQIAIMFPSIEACGFLEAIELVICEPIGVATGVWVCHLRTWTADRWRQSPGYGDEDDPTVELCERYPWRIECVPVLFPPFIDPIDFATVCADPPETGWEVWDWLGPFLAHYAECLFVPQGGVDRHGQIAASWNASAGGALASSAQTVLDAFYFEGSCGPLFASVPLGGVPVSIDTCQWTWAAAMKTALFWIILVLGMWRAISFAIALIQSAVGATPAPTPIGSDD